MKQLPLLIEIGHEEMPAMPTLGGDFSDHMQEGSGGNYLAVKLFDHLKKSPLFSNSDASSGDASLFVQATSRRMAFYFPKVDSEITNKIANYQVGPAISKNAGAGLVQAYRGFLKKHDERLAEKMLKWSEEEILDYINGLQDVPLDDQDGFFRFAKDKQGSAHGSGSNQSKSEKQKPAQTFLCYGGLFVKSVSAKEVIEKILPEALKSVFEEMSREGFSAQMYWGEKQGPFLRPIRNLCVILGEELVACEIYGVKSSRESFSHRLFRLGGSSVDKKNKKHHFGGVVVPIKNACDYFFEVARHGVLLGSDGYFLAGGGVDSRWHLTKEQNEKVNRQLFGGDLSLSKKSSSAPSEKPLPLPEIFKPHLGQEQLQAFVKKSFGSSSFLLCLLVVQWLHLLKKSFKKEAKKSLFSDLVLFCVEQFENNFRQKLTKEESVKNADASLTDVKQREAAENLLCEIFPFKILYYRDLPYGVSPFSHLASAYLLRYEYPQPFVLAMPLDLNLPDFAVLEVLKIQEYYPVYAKRHESLVEGVELEKELMPVCIGIVDNPNSLSSSIKEGHERVLKARLADAEFFYQKDTDMGIDRMREKLKDMSYHVDIGSYDDYVSYAKQLADSLWEMGFFKSDLKKLDDLKLALNYAKADLASEMIGEYPDLAGRMGANYLLKKKEQAKNGDMALIAYALYWQNFDVSLLLEEEDAFSFWSFSLFFSPVLEKESVQGATAKEGEREEVGNAKEGGEKNPLKNSQEENFLDAASSGEVDFMEQTGMEQTSRIFSPRKKGALPMSLNFVDSLCHVTLLYATGLRPLGRGDKYGLRPQVAKIVESAIIKNWTIDLKVIAPLICDVQRGIITKEQGREKTLPKAEETIADLSKAIGKSFSTHFDYVEKWYWRSLIEVARQRGEQFAKMVVPAIIEPAIFKQIFNPDLLVQRYGQIIEFAKDGEHFTRYLEALKRIGNILRKSNENIDNLIEHFAGHWKQSYYASLDDENAEKKLYMKHLEIVKQVEALDKSACDRAKRQPVSTVMRSSAKNYFVDRVAVDWRSSLAMKSKLFQEIIQNNPFIVCRQYLKRLDLFFDNIMINDSDENIRKNRLSFLAQMQRVMSGGVDFDRLR